MNIKNRRLRSQEANPGGAPPTQDGARAGSSNPQSKPQTGNSASKTPALGVGRGAKVAALAAAGKASAFLPVLAGKPGAGGLTGGDRTPEDGTDPAGSSASLGLGASDSQASPLEHTTTSGMGASARAGVTGSSGVYGSLTHVAAGAPGPFTPGRPSDVGCEGLANMRPSYIAAQMAQTEPDGFPSGQRMMQLGVPGGKHRPSASSPGAGGQPGSSWSSVRSPVPQKQLQPHQASGVMLHGQPQSVISLASLSSNGMTAGANQLHRSYNSASYHSAQGPPSSTPGRQKPPVH